MTDHPIESPPPGLCERCTYAQRIESAKGSVFWMCRHPELPKYPRLPVVECVGYRPAPEDDTGSGR